mmetsp:Transcript_53943/g.66117  ORF Transcript_53943/g.66117 Transcript_53943/m.66117 type:complete len:306 (+) Transcript_53943:65-982(+)
MSDFKQEYGQFTFEEVKECFRVFDLDNNNFVGATELKRIYQILGENCTDDDIDEMISMCDDDGDGQIDLKEFANIIFKHTGGQKESDLKQIKTNDKDNKKLSKLLNSNQDNVSKNKLPSLSPPKQKIKKVHALTKQELRNRVLLMTNMLKQLNINENDINSIEKRFGKMNNDEGLFSFDEFCECLDDSKKNPVCGALFQLFQHDKDIKLIDYREFLIALVNVLTNDKYIKAKFCFKLFDRDGSNSIDRDELIKILQSTHFSSEEQVSKKADTIFHHTDENDDGELSFDEFINVVDKFPNLIFPSF